MRRSRLIAVVLVGLLGAWLLWRQFIQRRHVTRQGNYAAESSYPVWTSTSTAPSGSVVKGLPNTAERTHNQSDALSQPQEPTLPAPSQPSADILLSADTKLESETAVEPDTASESDNGSGTTPPDDLIRIEGIGPKLSTIVVAAGITTFADLARTDVARLQAILDEAGIHTANPSTWPEQAGLAAQGKWDALNELQDRIKNGRLET